MRLIAPIALFPFAALAQDAAAPQGSPLASLLPLILIAAVFYFFMIRPQIRRHKELAALQAGLKKGDEIVTSGGAIGKFVRDADETTAVIEIAPGVEIKVLKATIANVLGKTPAQPAVKKKDARVKNDNVVPDKENVANDN